MARYRRRPVEIDAIQWSGVRYPEKPKGNVDAVIAWVEAQGGTARWVDFDRISGQTSQTISVRGPHSWPRVCVGAWVLCDAAGEFSTLGEMAFAAQWEVVR